MPAPIFTIPTFEAPMVDLETGRATRAWYLPLLSLFQPLPEVQVTVGGSPFSYVATQGGSLLVSGGTVTQITLKRNQVYVTGLTNGFIPVSAGDVVTITHAGAPSLVFFPR